jgi:hypothetical protein
LILGGVESAEALERMQAAAHLSLLFQLGRASSFDANADADASAEINLPELPATAEQALAPARLEAWREPQGAVLERAREIHRAAKSIHDSHADYCSALARYFDALCGDPDRVADYPELLNDIAQCLVHARQQYVYLDVKWDEAPLLAGGRLAARFATAAVARFEQRALEPEKRAEARYGQACSYALLDQRGSLLRALREAVELDPDNAARARSEPSFVRFGYERAFTELWSTERPTLKPEVREPAAREPAARELKDGLALDMMSNTSL